MNIHFNTKSSKTNIFKELKSTVPSTVKQTSRNLSRKTKECDFQQYLSPEKRDLLHQAVNICRMLLNRRGVHSIVAMHSAGFHYTNNGDTVRCDVCKLEVSDWTLYMKPFTIHAQRSPKCAVVCSILPDGMINKPITVNLLSTTSASDDNEKPSKRQKIEITQESDEPNILVEINMMKQIRKRTFSHWPHRMSPSNAQMIAAGFFSCNVGDRVICIYCNIICQQWTPHSDDPYEIHKTLSPKCPFVVAMLKQQQTSSILIINDSSNNEQLLTSNGFDPFRSNEIVYTAACHTAYIEIPKRHESFATWISENLPSVDDLVRAGFFYTGTKTIVTCFYCNGSLQNWGANDNPTIEHVRWFPHCAYAKQLCGAELYRKIQESKRAQQGSLLICFIK
jgi:hypothetical protein